MKKFLKFLDRLGNKHFFVFIFISFCVALFFLSYFRYNRFLGAQTLDDKYVYWIEDVYNFLYLNPKVDLEVYANYLLPVDLAFPLIYSFGMAAVLYFVGKKNKKYKKMLPLFVLIPFVAAFFDYIENFSTLYLIKSMEVSNLFAAILSIVSFLKWFFVFVWFFVLLIILF